MNFKSRLRHLFHPRQSNNHRPKILHPQSYAFFVVIGVAFFIGIHSLRYWPSYFQGVLGYASSITASQVVAQTNSQRQQYNLPPLMVNNKLNQAALAKAEHIFAHQYWSHVAPDGTEPWQFVTEAGYRYQAAGENLARDFPNTSEMIGAWMASATHRDNIVNPRYQEIGVAVVDGELLGYETTLVVQLFGTQLAHPAEIGQKSAQDGQVVLADQEPANLNPATGKVAVLAALSESQSTGVEPEVMALTFPYLEKVPLFSPLQLIKSVFLAIIVLVITTLFYDLVIVRNTNTVRLVGKNMAHIMLLIAVGYIIIIFKGGVII